MKLRRLFSLQRFVSLRNGVLAYQCLVVYAKYNICSACRADHQSSGVAHAEALADSTALRRVARGPDLSKYLNRRRRFSVEMRRYGISADDVMADMTTAAAEKLMIYRPYVGV